MNRLGVVTVTFNSALVLEPFIDCCAAQAKQDFLLVVIDNDSRDSTREILKRRGDGLCVVLNDDNLGVAEGNNQGIRIALEAGCNRVLLINNDTEFSPTLFSELDRALSACGGDALTPRIVYHDRPDVDWFNGGEFKYFWGPDARHDAPPSRDISTDGRVRRTSYAPTCCMIVERHVFDVIGFMDERYFVYWDDTDFCLRMQRAGLALLCDSGIWMSHKVSSLTGGTMTNFFIRYHHRNQIYYVRKHFGMVVLGYTLLMSILKAAIRVPLRGDTLPQFRLRLRSMREGLAMPVASRTSVPNKYSPD